MESHHLTHYALQERLPKWGITVLESHHAPDFVMEWRRHPFIKVIYALNGNGVLEVEGNRYDFREKDVMIVPAGQQNRVVDTPNYPASLYVLCLSPALLSFDDSIEERLVTGRLSRSEHLANRVEALLRRLLFQQSNGGQEASLAMAASALNLLQLVTEKPSDSNAIEETQKSARTEMARYIEYLDSHFFEAEDISDAARKLGISRRAFTKRFREMTGKSWLAYVRTKAVDHAAHLLLETSAPIASIAFECGFSDLSTFYRHFKSQMKVAPAAWRKSVRPSDS